MLNYRYLVNGILFSLLWASASIAGKFGLYSAEPLFLFTIRFFMAGTLLIGYACYWNKERLPEGPEWKHLIIFSTFNTALYLGIFIIALQYITAGITALAIALNPLLISVMSSMISKRFVQRAEWVSILAGMTGVFIASFPLLDAQEISINGLLLLILSMFMYSIGAVYYAAVPWKLSLTMINGWQVLVGGILIAPFAFLLHTPDANQLDGRFWLSVFWLVIPVSIVAVHLWLILLKTDAVRASIWLYLCPVFGLLLSAWLLNESLSIYTAIGTLLVLAAVFIGQQKMFRSAGKS